MGRVEPPRRVFYLLFEGYIAWHGQPGGCFLMKLSEHYHVWIRSEGCGRGHQVMDSLVRLQGGVLYGSLAG